MANLGALGEFMVSKKFYLQVGSNQYIGIEELQVHMERAEFRRTPLTVGPLYRYGFGDNWVSGQLKLTGPEWGDAGAASINKLSQIDGVGDMINTSFLIKAEQTDGTVLTFTFNGTIKIYDVRRTEKYVTMDFFIRILDDEVAITTV